MVSERFPTFCEQGICPEFPEQADQGKRVCAIMQERMLEAGASNFLEVVKCPVKAMHWLAVEKTDPGLLELKNRLGVVGIVEGSFDA